MIRRPPRSTLSSSSAASDVYKRELLPGDLIAGGRFNMMTSMCWTEQETKEVNQLIYGKKGSRAKMKWFHDHGYGNSGATSGHIIPGYEKALNIGLSLIHISRAHETPEHLVCRLLLEKK